MKRWISACLFASVVSVMCGDTAPARGDSPSVGDGAWAALRIEPDTAGDPAMTLALARLDTALRLKFEIEVEQTAVGLLDLQTGRVAMLRADTMYYAASVPKIAILLAYFQTHPEAAEDIDDVTRRELGLMIKRSDNALAAKYSRLIGLETIADVLTSPRYRLYDPMHGGGLWMGKHYARGDERNRDPLAGESHAATVRQLLRYYLMLEQGRLVSPQASGTMREIFESPDIEHLNSKIVKALAGRDVKVIRKSGTWRDWYADSAVITGVGRHYVLAVLTHTPAPRDHPDRDPPRAVGDEYIVSLSRGIDGWAQAGFAGEAPREVNKPDSDTQSQAKEDLP
jgi:beta-lactamase class A